MALIHSESLMSQRLTRAGDPRNRPAVKWLIRGVTPVSRTFLLVGDDGSGKSALAANLAVSVATGENWLGRSTLQGGVIFAALEKYEDVTTRLDVLNVQHGGKLPIFYFRGPLDLSEKESNSDALLIQAIEKAKNESNAPIRLLIIDNFACAFTGNELSNSDIGRFNRSLARIVERTGIAICVVHHTTKPGGQYAGERRERSAGALRAAVDAALMVTEKKGVRTVKVYKSNVGSEGVIGTSRIESMPIPERDEQRGEFSEIPVVVPMTYDQISSNDTTGALSSRANAILSIIRDHGPSMGRLQLFHKAQAAGHLSQNDKSARELLRKSLTELQAASLIEYDEKFIRIQPSPQSANKGANCPL